MTGKKLNLNPLGDRLVIEPQAVGEKSHGGIILPGNAREKPQRGTVLAAGPGRIDEDGKRIQMAVKPGDLVLYARSNGTEIKFDHKKLLILKESDILAVFEN